MQDVDEELHDVWFEKVPELDIASVVPAPMNDGCSGARQPRCPKNGYLVCDAEFRASTGSRLRKLRLFIAKPLSGVSEACKHQGEKENR